VEASEVALPVHCAQPIHQNHNGTSYKSPFDKSATTSHKLEALITSVTLRPQENLKGSVPGCNQSFKTIGRIGHVWKFTDNINFSPTTTT